MSSLGRSQTTARRALWFVGLLVLLTGIVAMHGLNSHGGGMDPATHAIVLHEPGTAPAGSGHDLMAAAVPEVSGSVVAGGAAVAARASGMQAGLTGMCMAVLALALTALLRMLRNAPALQLCRLAGAPGRVPRPHGRDPDPPSLISLSIRRC